MLVGYVRVSKADGSQVTDLQRDALLAAGVDRGNIYEDMTSGRRDDRPGLTACLKALRERDTLIVWKLDRLGRDRDAGAGNSGRAGRRCGRSRAGPARP